LSQRGWDFRLKRPVAIAQKHTQGRNHLKGLAFGGEIRFPIPVRISGKNGYGGNLGLKGILLFPYESAVAEAE